MLPITERSKPAMLAIEEAFALTPVEPKIASLSEKRRSIIPSMLFTSPSIVTSRPTLDAKPFVLA